MKTIDDLKAAKPSELNALLGQTLTFLILGAALMLGMRTIETIWPKPVQLVVCVEHPNTTRDCSKWKDIAK